MALSAVHGSSPLRIFPIHIATVLRPAAQKRDDLGYYFSSRIEARSSSSVVNSAVDSQLRVLENGPLVG